MASSSLQAVVGVRVVSAAASIVAEFAELDVATGEAVELRVLDVSLVCRLADLLQRLHDVVTVVS